MAHVQGLLNALDTDDIAAIDNVRSNWLRAQRTNAVGLLLVVGHSRAVIVTSGSQREHRQSEHSL
jgi:high-affinity nickel permease